MRRVVKPTKEEANRFCWETGALAWCLHKGQYDLYQRQSNVKPHEEVVATCARQFGKTLEELVFVDEFARRNKDSLIRFVAPSRELAQDIVLPTWEFIWNGIGQPDRACPDDLRPQHTSAGYWLYPLSNSRIYLVGADAASKRLRGPKSNILILDEAGFFDDLKRAIDTVGPQLDSTRGNMFISSTPPITMDHPFVEYWERAERDGRLIFKTVFDNPMRTQDDLRRICQRVNTKSTPEEVDEILAGRLKGSPEWRREYLCEMVSDDTKRVCPEFDPDLHVRELPRPEFFQPYVFLDFGFQTDYTAALFGYFDFSIATLVIEDELVVRRLNSRDVAGRLLACERRLWPKPGKQPLRYGDSRAAQQIYDLQSVYNYPISPAGSGKLYGHDGDGLVNYLREMIGSDRVIVNPRCRNTIKQLKEGIWKLTRDKQQIDSALRFQRSEEMGHLDCIAALMYGVRNIDWRHNPVPKGMVNHYTHYYLGPEEGEARDLTRRLSNFFAN